MSPTELPQPNIPLLRKAVEWAEAEAAKTDGTCLWYQRNWAVETECGTAYCIAGFVVTQTVAGASVVIPDWDADDPYAVLQIDGARADWISVGRDALGLTADEASGLFHEDNTIGDVRRIAEQIAARDGVA